MDVTVPGNPDFWQILAVGYSYVPFLVVVAAVVELLIRRGTRQLSLLVFAGTITGLNELIIKRIVQQPRPGAVFSVTPTGETYPELFGSCVNTCGMPSSHSTMSIGFLVLLFLDTGMRVVPSRGSLNGHETMRSASFTEPANFFSVMPLWPKPIMSHSQFLYFVAVWSTLLGPVPLMRVQLHDHTVAQVLVGCVLGAFEAVCYYFVLYHLMERYEHLAGRSFCYNLVRHNYWPTRFMVVSGSRIAPAREIVAVDLERSTGGNPTSYCHT